MIEPPERATTAATHSIPVRRGHSTLPLAVDDLPDGVLVTSDDGRVLAANAVFLELTGRDATSLLHQQFESLLAEEDMVRLIGFRAMFGERVTRDNNVAFVTPAGERRPLVVSAIRSRDERRVIMTMRAPGSFQEALADGSRWAAEEQER